MKLLGIVSVVLAILFSLLSLISGIGVMGSFIALIISGISSIKCNFNYVIIVSIIITLNLSLFSVVSIPSEEIIEQPVEFPEIRGIEKTAISKSPILTFAKLVMPPYVITLFFVVIGAYRCTKKHNEQG